MMCFNCIRKLRTDHRTYQVRLTPKTGTPAGSETASMNTDSIYITIKSKDNSSASLEVLKPAVIVLPDNLSLSSDL